MRRLFSICMMCLFTTALFAQNGHKLNIKTQPLSVASFAVMDANRVYLDVDNVPTGEFVQVSMRSTDMYRYWKIKEWKVVEGNAVLSYKENNDYRYTYSDFDNGDVTFTMPDEDVTIVVFVEYDPQVPDVVSPNGWYPDDGLLVLDYVNGTYTDALFKLISDAEDINLVRRIVVAGPHSEYGGVFDFLSSEFSTMDSEGSFSSLETVDLGRLGGLKEVGYVTQMPWTTLILPASVQKIPYPWYGTHIENLTLYATTPPEIPYDWHWDASLQDYVKVQALVENPEEMTVFVPEESLPLYQAADGWKDFKLRPIVEDAGSLVVNVLPNETPDKLTPYYSMTLEIQDVKSLEKRHQLIYNRQQYTFNTLPKGTTYNVRILNRTGASVAEATNVFLDKDNVDVNFNELRKPCDVNLRVFAGDKVVDPSKYSYIWFNQYGNVVANNTKLAGVLEDEPVSVTVTLNDTELKGTYQAKQTAEISEPGVHSLAVNYNFELAAIPTHSVTTTVLRSDGEYMGEQTIRQRLYRIMGNENVLVKEWTYNSPSGRGEYPYVGIRSEKVEGLTEGEYETTALIDDTENYTETLHFTLDRDTALVLHTEEVKGSVISATWKHYGVAELGADINSALSLSRKITEAPLRIFDNQSGEEIKDFVVSTDGAITLRDKLAEGTILRITLGSPNAGTFLQTEQKVALDEEGNGSVDFVTRDFGTMQVGFVYSESSDVVAKVFTEQGNLYRTISLRSENNSSITGVRDGNYTVVYMDASTGFANQLNSLEDIRAYLRNYNDYTEKDFKVSSGLTTDAQISVVPTMPTAKFISYTDDETRINVKRGTLHVGLYQTLSLRTHFKPEYKGRISSPKVVVTLSEESGVKFLDNSVLINSRQTSYNKEGNTIEIPIVEDALLRFCVIPTIEGQTVVNARLKFLVDGSECVQPLFCPEFTAEGDEFYCSPFTYETYLPLRGTATPNAKVTVYANDKPWATVKADAEGNWKTSFVVPDKRNMSKNRFFVERVTPEGHILRTPERVSIIDRYTVRPMEVVMWHYNHWLMHSEFVVFDFRTMSSGGYYYFYRDAPFDIRVELSTADTTNIDKVLLYVKTNKTGEYEEVPLTYAGGKFWKAKKNYGFGVGLPINVDVEVLDHGQKYVGENYIEDRLHYYQQGWDDYANAQAKVDSLQNVIATAEAGSETEQQAMYELVQLNGLLQKGFNEAYDANEGKEGFDPNYPDPNNRYYPGYTGGKYAEGETGMQQWMRDVDALSTNFDDWFNKVGLGTSEWNLEKPKALNDAGEVVPGYTVRHPQSSTRQRYLNIQAMEGDHKKELNFNEFELKTEDGKSIFVTVREDGYSLVMPSEDLEVYVDYNKTIPGYEGQFSNIRGLAFPTDSASLISLKASNAFIEAIEQIKASVANKLMELMTAYDKFQSWLRDVEGVIEANWRVGQEMACTGYEKYRDCIDRGWEYVPIAQPYLEKCKNLEKAGAEAMKKFEYYKSQLEKLKANKYLGAICGIASLYSDYTNFLKTCDDMVSIYNSIPDPCPEDQAEADEIKDYLFRWGIPRLAQQATGVISDIASVTAAIVGVITGPGSLGAGTVIGAGISVGISVLNFAFNTAMDWGYEGFFTDIRSWVAGLKCKSPKKRPDKFKDVNPILDPSGYVYEAVGSNRVEGATASCYEQYTYEDAYGDLYNGERLWDAAKYDQENPLVTDDQGKYAWDVPAGMYQVRINKDKYLNTNSEWLPVPPPQMDVNLPLVSVEMPKVEKVKASEKGVEVFFDKYMRLGRLNADHVFFTKAGQKVEGDISFVNAEQAPDTTVSYASRLMFTPKTPFTVSENVVLTVKRDVQSYAGIEMEQDFTQEFDVLKYVETILADSAVNINRRQERTLVIGTVPADAAVGKSITATVVAGDTTVTMKENVLTIDENGQASLVLTGNEVGSAVIRLQMTENPEIERMMYVDVDIAANRVAIAPRASRVSGTEVYQGTKITLTTETPNAEIYYSLDGTCPCETESPSVMKYTGPITIDGDVTIKAMTLKADYIDSDVQTFTYKLRKNSATYDIKRGWNWVSHNQSGDFSNTEIFAKEAHGYIVDNYMSTVTNLQPATTYRAFAATEINTTIVGPAWNASDNSIYLEEGWNWMGYPMNQVMTTGEALAYAQAQPGDMIVGQDGFAEYVGNAWMGSLATLVPGRGYRYKSMGTKSISLNNSITSTANIAKPKTNTMYWTPNPTAGPDIMPVTAQLFTAGGVKAGDNYEMAAYCGDKIRTNSVIYADDMYYLPVSGTEGEEITFYAFDSGSETVYNIVQTQNFQADNVGTHEAPVRFTLGDEATGLPSLRERHEGSDMLYNLQGVRLPNDKKLQRGVYIRGKEKIVVK